MPPQSSADIPHEHDRLKWAQQRNLQFHRSLWMGAMYGWQLPHNYSHPIFPSTPKFPDLFYRNVARISAETVDHSSHSPLNERALGECIELVAHWINRYVRVVGSSFGENTGNALKNRMAWIWHHLCSVRINNDTIGSHILLVWIALNETTRIRHHSVRNVESIFSAHNQTKHETWTTKTIGRGHTCEATPNYRTGARTAFHWLLCCPVRCAEDSHSTTLE